MRLVRLNKCQSGIKLGRTIYSENGKILLSKGTELTNSFIKRLQNLNIYTVYIEDNDSEGIDIVESIPAQLLNEATNTITEGLNTIVEINTMKPSIQGMIKTEKAVSGFQKIFKDILTCLTENPTVLNLLATTKIHENHVYTHSLNVTIYACQLAIENDLPQNQIEEIGLGALLHDLGKIFVSPEVLNKPGRLTREEFEQMKSHSELGFDILRKVHSVPLVVAHCALQHHERLDGTGYPRGITGSRIHPYAKILSVADVFDAVTSHRVYRPAMLPHQGMELLYSGSGTQFDTEQLKLFKNCIAIYPQGLTVKLNDGRTGIVTKYNFSSVGRPEIRIIQDEEGQRVTPYEIDLSKKGQLTLEIVEADALL
ncbi:putative nucleotidyltransferase with HDIG domain [Metabacillus crassostreae]|uniref:HD-GYP domain-containing protein n=1 Tax=Metabacillus crassostreae TaxID=929098 RepID=UPI00195C1A02|nr:HD-GYP domain-containing protein [Metabacillus crassostreae]MBM7602344.1 putative nucleotidyltransferase with HDIG domain [Metabacillus crassostreae]